MPLDSTTLAVLAILFASTMVRAVFGFGNALIAMPLLAMVIPIRTATPLVAITAQFMACCLLIPHWREVELRSAWKLILASAIGVPAGLLFLKGVHPGVVKTALAALLLGFSAWSLMRRQLVRSVSERWAYPFGFLAGLLGGAYNTNGPPVVVYGALRHWTPAQFRATLQGYFFIAGLMVLTGHGAAGLWTTEVFALSLAGIPVMAAALLLGNRIHQRIPAEKYARAIYMLLIAVSVLLLVRTWWPS